MSAALAGGIIAGLGAVAGAGINAASAASNTNWALSESASENEKQRIWAQQQAAQANQWNMQNWREQFAAQSEQAMKMFDTYNAYNKPSAVVQRLRDAGFNPAAYFQSGSSQGMSNYANLSAPSSSPASAGIPSAGMQAFNVQPSTLNFTEAFEGISRAYENFMSAREKSTNAQRMTTLLGAEQKLMIEKANNAELLNAFQQMENWYTKTNLPNRVERAIQETLEVSSKVAFNKSATEYNQSKTLTEAFNRLNAEMDYSLKGEQLTQAKTLSRYYEAQLLAHIEATKASAANEYANANRVEQMTPYEVEMAKNAAFIDTATFMQRYDTAISRLQADKSISEKERQEAINMLGLAKDYASAREHDSWRKFDSTLEIFKKKFPSLIGIFR